MSVVAVAGSATWGTTLAIMLARKGLDVRLWTRTPDEAARLGAERENRRSLPGVPFPPSLRVTADPAEALAGADLLILAVPAQSMRANVCALGPHVRLGTLVVSVAKGLELETERRMSEVIAEELGPAFRGRIGALSGPNLAKEVAAGLPSASVVAAADLSTAGRARDLLMTPTFRVYSHDDLIGVELGGALKNIIAIGAGICDGLALGDNAKAAFMTRGLAEITRLAVAAGARPLTLAGLAGLGDLVATCSSRLSRNRLIGEALARGRQPAELQAEIRQVAEGVSTTRAARALARRLGVEMPITEATYRVLFEGHDPRQAVAELLSRRATRELAGIDE